MAPELELPEGPALLTVLSGFSGSGKDAVRDLLMAWKLPVHFVVTATNRPMRPGEVEGIDYLFVSDAEFDRYLAETDRQRFTPSTVTAEKALRKDIAEVRRSGFSWADEEFSLGIIGIGRAVTMDGETVGALSVAIPKVRCDEATRHRIMDLLERTAGLLETA